MDDKWFVFEEEGVLWFCRSWTGICIFKLVLGGVDEHELLVEPDFMSKSGPAKCIKIVGKLIDMVLEPVEVPVNMVPTGIVGNIVPGWPYSSMEKRINDEGEIELFHLHPLKAIDPKDDNRSRPDRCR